LVTQIKKNKKNSPYGNNINENLWNGSVGGPLMGDIIFKLNRLLLIFLNVIDGNLITENVMFYMYLM
jgi:hypothetical protein